MQREHDFKAGNSWLDDQRQFTLTLTQVPASCFNTHELFMPVLPMQFLLDPFNQVHSSICYKFILLFYDYKQICTLYISTFRSCDTDCSTGAKKFAKILIILVLSCMTTHAEVTILHYDYHTLIQFQIYILSMVK